MSESVDEVVERMRKYASVERTMGTLPDDMAIASLDTAVRLYIANGKSLRQCQELLAWVWEQNFAEPLRLVGSPDEPEAS